MGELTDLEKQVLDFESRRWKYAGVKEDTISRTFDISPTRYQQWLLTLIDRPEALVYAPQLVHRLRRLRDQRRAERQAG